MNKTEAMQVLDSIPDDEPVFILRASRRTDRVGLLEKVKEGMLKNANAETHVYGPYQTLQRFRAWAQHNQGEMES